MSVIMTLQAHGDPAAVERYAERQPDALRSIVEHAKERGVIAHRFYGSDDGRILVVDEWPDAESFQSFFSAMGDQIEPMMREAGVTEQPQVTFWHKLETHDEVGWGA
jgi:heme-degrading monooxygenase HmoA